MARAEWEARNVRVVLYDAAEVVVTIFGRRSDMRIWATITDARDLVEFLQAAITASEAADESAPLTCTTCDCMISRETIAAARSRGTDARYCSARCRMTAKQRRRRQGLAARS